MYFFQTKSIHIREMFNYEMLSCSAPFPECLSLVYSIVEMEVSFSSFVDLSTSDEDRGNKFVFYMLLYIVLYFYFLSALYQARGLEADGGGFQFHLPIQPTSQTVRAH